MRDLNMEEITIVSGAGDLYDSPTSPEGNLLDYPDNIFTTLGEPMFEVWQAVIAN